MNIFDVYGYRSDRPYSNESKTNVGYFALLNAGGSQSYTLTASHGSYSITGQDATFSLARAYSLTGEYGSYAITGQDAVLSVKHNYSLSCQYGSYDIVGNDANLTYSPTVLTTVETLIKLRSFTEHRRF